MLEELLSKLGASTRITVGVSVSPNVGLEMIQVDSATGTIVKYSYRPLEYNTSLREIKDYEQFKVGLEELFEELNIPKTSNIVLSLPNVYFGTITLPTLLPDEGITNAIISEVEQSYIFKRSEPVTSWSDVSVNTASDSRFIAYSAIQKSSVDSILEICASIGCKVTSIENSYNSLFRALSYLKITETQMQDNNTSWNLMIIQQNSYAIISMVGTRPVDYFEEPLALKTFVDEEIYNAIKTSAQLTLMNLPANHLVIVSETDLVSAEILSLKLPFDGKKSFLESNKFSQKELMPTSLNILQNKVQMITADAIGAGIWLFHQYPLKINFAQKGDGESDFDDDSLEEYPKINIGTLEVELTPSFIKKIALIAALAILLPLLIVLFFLNSVIYPKTNSQIQDLDAQIEAQKLKIKQQKDASQNVSFDTYTSINSTIHNNKNKLAYFRALEYSMPSNLWITYYETNNEGQVDIKGTTTSTQNVYSFYKNMRQMINSSNITLKRLELSDTALDTLALSSASGSRYYQFEITNMPNITSSTRKSLNDMATNSNNQEPRKSLFELGQPWLQTEIDNNNPNNNGNMPMQNAPQSMPMPQNNNGLPPNLQKIEDMGGKR